MKHIFKAFQLKVLANCFKHLIKEAIHESSILVNSRITFDKSQGVEDEDS